ncbi:hypothetical protein MIV115R [Invertebrate iridescent virus 3]|uniref:Uncharacterized protein 115R n=1 Tax=Invertebrate iridescent virus 3 TaxID=345201 RepID=VF342_IIV3|nr:hypothetical protein MIV115R [Invertebrate iridescent virus 3]Q196U5.1 RecName: Full=Uncharacterized protein 115R [Invertebrate iridescent virus 3]ABF82145.1 hypothetical protein MIV115R [Invertebrate iridescent virus 3]
MDNSAQKSCSYTPVACYNAYTPAQQGFYVVPDYQTYGYQTLTSARAGALPSCSRYFSVQNAYGSCSTMSYVRKDCI